LLSKKLGNYFNTSNLRFSLCISGFLCLILGRFNGLLKELEIGGFRLGLRLFELTGEAAMRMSGQGGLFCL
jgi:hypothetical protein